MGTIYTGKYQNHSIRIDNSMMQCKLFLDGVEKDVLKGLSIQEGGHVLQAFIREGDSEDLIQVFIDVIPIKKAALIPTVGYRFVIKVNGNFLDTGFLKRSHQRKYGELLKRSSDSAKNT